MTFLSWPNLICLCLLFPFSTFPILPWLLVLITSTHSLFPQLYWSATPVEIMPYAIPTPFPSPSSLFFTTSRHIIWFRTKVHTTLNMWVYVNVFPPIHPTAKLSCDGGYYKNKTTSTGEKNPVLYTMVPMKLTPNGICPQKELAPGPKRNFPLRLRPIAVYREREFSP